MLLAVSGIHKAFGVDQILTGTTLRIDRREKVALVGRNGTGKTTLLKIVTQQLEPDQGSVQIARGAKIGYLRQEAPVDLNRTVLEEAEEARKHVLQLQQRLQELEAKLEHGATDEDLEEYATLHEHFMELEGYSADRDLRTVLQRMGFDASELDKPASKLSGGEKTRLALARLLLEEPDLLILDEPTNHLDLQATEWLEGWLRGYPGAVLLVSHDRAFLQNTAERVIEMRGGAVKSYPGPFDKFLKLKAEEELRQAEVAKQQQQQIDRMDEYVRRFMGSERTAQARGRLKHLEKLIASKVDAPKKDRAMASTFKTTKRSGDVVVEVKDLAMSFGEQKLFRGVDWTVRSGERWGVVGENGSGKSTLVRIALGLLDPKAGGARLGSNVVAGYFAQDTVSLNPEQSPLDYLVYDFDLLPAEARNLLGRFLFSGDDVFRPVKTLSGGEKNKLVLAGLTTLNPNLLILDEPTNHLDMDSREALAGVLRDYKGTLVLVSHDRWLLDQVTDHTLDLRRDGVRTFPGNFGEYRRRKLAAKAPAPASAAVAAKQQTTLSPREVSKEIQRLTAVVAEMETEIAFTEGRIRTLERTLSNVPAGTDVLDLTVQYRHQKETLEGQIASWEENSTALEKMQALQG